MIRKTFLALCSVFVFSIALTSCPQTSSGNTPTETGTETETDVSTCAAPVISGTASFTTSTLVTITSETKGAGIYYTIDGTSPSKTNGTVYSGEITLTESATIKAIAIKDGCNNSSVSSKKFTKKTETSKSGVMLQGFNWDSAPRGNDSMWSKWYTVVKNNADAIKDTFEYVWCPPPSKCDTSSSEGYAPSQLNDLNNCYGTESQLKSMIKAISPAKAIADIVINHRAGTSSWADFSNPTWTDDYYSICSDDECFSDSKSPVYGNTKTGAADTGDTYGAYRDLDHTNTAVQQGIIDWMNNVLKAAGFVGWRYDYVKGYGGNYVGLYDKNTEAEFSVGEYWPTAGYDSSNPSGWGNTIKSWISDTETGGYRSRAFDFALKGAMNTVFGSNASGISNSNYALLADSSNLYISQSGDAVTFVDNHDTGSTQKHWYLDPDDVGTAYALILTHPGYPCVAWNHYFTYAESGSNGTDSGAQYMAADIVSGTTNTLRQHIDKLIELRNNLGIEYDSSRTTVAATNGYYVAEVTGSKGNLLVMIGSGWSKTSSYSDYDEFYKGTNFTIWTEGLTSKCKTPVITITDGSVTITCATEGAVIRYTTDGTAPDADSTLYTEPFDVTEGALVKAYATLTDYADSSVASCTYLTSRTLTVSVESWIWNDSAEIFAWVWGDSSLGEWISVTGSDSTATIIVPADTTGFNMARCVQGTTEPSWTAVDNESGRVYNKTDDVPVTSDTDSYSTTWSEYSFTE